MTDNDREQDEDNGLSPTEQTVRVLLIIFGIVGAVLLASMAVAKFGPRAGL